MKNRDIISSIFWLILGLGVSYGGYDLDIGSLHDPGSGFIFLGVGIIMVALSLGVLIMALRETATPGELKQALWTEIRWRKIVYVLVALILYAMVFEFLGFNLSTVLLMTFLFRAVEPQSWSKAVLGALISIFTTYGLFQLLLGSQFPKGFLGF